jgi:chromosome segregation ATPase
MKRKFCIVCILTLFVNVVPILSSPQDTLADLSRIKAALQADIATIEQKIKQTDSLSRNEEQRFTEQKKRLEADLVAKEQENENLGKRLDELDLEIRKLSSQIEELQMQERSINKNMSFLGQKIAQQCMELEKIIKRSLPWNREVRLARVSALKNDLISGAANAQEGFSRLNALIAEEKSFGDDIVLEQRSVQRNNGTLVNSQMLRIGNLFMVYVDQAEELYGVLSRSSDTTFTWREELSFTEREEIRTAVRVKEGKKAPVIVTLPLTLSVGNLEENNEK